MKKRLPTIALLLVFIIGLSLLLYPAVSDYWNSLHQSRAVAEYVETAANIDYEAYERLWGEAQAYNSTLLSNENRYILSDAEREEYFGLLNIAESGIMGYVEIPSIRVMLPVYHGVEDSVLQTAVGHMQGTSLPVGGRGTHCVLTGHRGLPSAKLFTNLDKLSKGDLFILQVLGETLTYSVDQILIVEPTQMAALTIDRNEDYCTLVTCTPYGINTHRLLVRGHRVETAAAVATVRVTADAVQVDPVLVAPMVAAPILLVLLIVLLVKYPRRRES